MRFHLKRTVVFVGMMGSGKTAIGHAVARRLDVPFLDSDAEIEKAANMTIAEIFSRDGEAFFRQKETQVIERLLKTERCILATGGGAYMQPGNRELIHDFGIALWLKADVDLLWARVRHKETRPLLKTEDPRLTLENLYRDRAPHYAKAELFVEARPDYSIEDMSARVIDALQTRPDILEKR